MAHNVLCFYGMNVLGGIYIIIAIGTPLILLDLHLTFLVLDKYPGCFAKNKSRRLNTCGRQQLHLFCRKLISFPGSIIILILTAYNIEQQGGGL